MPVELAQRLISVKEYYKMAEVGILSEDDRVELILGKIIQISPIGSKHAASVDKALALLHKLNAQNQNVIIRGQNPVRLSDFSEPEPDIALLKPSLDYYASHHPMAKDVLLIIEVSDTTLDYDREVKLPIYATSNIPEYWIMNLGKREIEAYSILRDGQYQSRKLFLPGDEIPLNALNTKIAVDQIMV